MKGYITNHVDRICTITHDEIERLKKMHNSNKQSNKTTKRTKTRQDQESFTETDDCLQCKRESAVGVDQANDKKELVSRF